MIVQYNTGAALCFASDHALRHIRALLCALAGLIRSLPPSLTPNSTANSHCASLAKEALYYKKEAQDNEAGLAAMKAGGEGNVKQQEQVLGETLSMIPHSEALLKKNLEELSAMVQQQQQQEEEEETTGDGAGAESGSSGEWLTAAKKLLEENGMGSDGGDDGKAEEETTEVDGLDDGEAF